MAKQIILEPERTFAEFAIFPGYTSKDCNMNTVSLESTLTGLNLSIPLLSAAMTSVTGYEMALALGKEGGIGVLPARLSIDEQVEIVSRIKSHEMNFVEHTDTVKEYKSVEEVLAKINKHGHSKIPVVDTNNVFKGMFVKQHYVDVGGRLDSSLTDVMIPFKKRGSGIAYSTNPDLTIEEAKKILSRKKSEYLVVLDDQNRLVKMAFAKDMKDIKVASAISTHKGWDKRANASIEAGVDLIVMDTSDAHSYFAEKVVKHYKKLNISVPLCAGNIITYEGAEFLMNAGADMIKVGMSSGSICTTQREKAVGRAPMIALMEVDEARKQFLRKSGRYIPVIVDGGVSSAGDMAVALTVADAIMMGGYFNSFFESAGEKYDGSGTVTGVEAAFRKVLSYGEGSDYARNLERYGHSDMKTFFAEGEIGTVPYMGRLKPHVKSDMIKVKAAMVNAGAMNLEEFREKAVIALMSDAARAIIGDTHGLEVSK